ncbi:MAG TPA: hypothetical protein VD886_16320, partial [Herpetosiphonaceae bacterium]|nr:hypothetical protein [Herpetosiphonaceae bacterium]
LAPIGNSWGVEFYLPLASYLREFAYADLGQAPANPLVLTIQADPTYSRAIGFAYFQGIVDGVGGWESLRSFAPLLGFMRLLGAAGVFVFARQALGLGRWGAALAALLVALNEVMLWVQYTGFAMHASSMALVPIALALTALALRELRWRSTAAAGLLLSGLAANYHPALLGYGALAAGAGLWHLIRGPRRAAVVGHGLALLAGSGLATLLIQLRAGRAFFGVYEQGAAPLGTPDFISARTLLGLTPLASAEAPSPPPWGAAVGAAWPAVIWLAYGLALAAGSWWLWRGSGERGLALSMLALAGIYALGLRYAVGYPYGHMKGLSFISFVPLAVIAGGIGNRESGIRGRIQQSAVRSQQPPATGHRPPARILRALAAALLLLVVGSTAWDSFGLVRGGPTLYGRERLELLVPAAAVPPGATVLVSGVAGMRGPTVGLLAYALRHNPLIGNTAAGYAVYDALAEGDSADYAVLGADEDPSAWGFPGPPLWRNSIAAFYQANQRSAFLSGQAGAYQPVQGRALSQPTALEVVRFEISRYIALDQPLDLAVGAASLRRGTSAPAEDPDERALLLSVGAFEPATLTVSGGISQTFALTPGVTILRTHALATPGLVSIGSDRPVVLRWIEARKPLPAAPAQPAASYPAAVLVGASVTPGATGASISVQTPPTNQPLRMALEIYEDSTAPRHYGWALLPLGPADLDLDLAGRRLSVNGAEVPMSWGERAAGRYFAALWIYQGETLLGRLPLFTFTDDGGAASAVTPLDTNALAAALPEPRQRMDLAVGEIARLRGATITPAAPGRTARLSLWWSAQGPTPPTLVTAQVLGEDDHKWAQWDGALGGDASPGPSWAAGQTIRQDIPLALDPATPPGAYRLLVGAYAPDGTRLPLGGQESLTLEIEVPEQ